MHLSHKFSKTYNLLEMLSLMQIRGVERIGLINDHKNIEEDF